MQGVVAVWKSLLTITGFNHTHVLEPGGGTRGRTSSPPVVMGSEETIDSLSGACKDYNIYHKTDRVYPSYVAPEV
jgi:hypothetical protein